MLTAPIVKAAAEPQITPIRAPRATPPVAHSSPRLTSKDTTMNTIVDKITVPAILAIILHPLDCVLLCAPARSNWRRMLFIWSPRMHIRFRDAAYRLRRGAIRMF